MYSLGEKIKQGRLTKHVICTHYCIFQLSWSESDYIKKSTHMSDGYKYSFYLERITDHIYLIMKIFLASVLLSASVLLAEECPEMPPMVCADGDISCPMGNDEYGCPMPELCMTHGSICPAWRTMDCPEMPPMTCADGDISCPMGTDPMGCPMPEFCMPAGSICPAW